MAVYAHLFLKAVDPLHTREDPWLLDGLSIAVLLLAVYAYVLLSRMLAVVPDTFPPLAALAAGTAVAVERPAGADLRRRAPSRPTGPQVALEATPAKGIRRTDVRRQLGMMFFWSFQPHRLGSIRKPGWYSPTI